MASVSQSRTQWVAKGETVGGKVVKKGYLAQKGKPEKRVTANVKLVTETGTKRAGQTQNYSDGRKMVSNKPAFAVGGSNPSVKKKDISPTGGSTAAQIAARKAAEAKAAAARAAADSASDKSKKMSYQSGSATTTNMAASRARSAAQARTLAAANVRKKSSINYRNVAAANRKDSAAGINRRTANKPGKPKATVSESIPDIRNIDLVKFGNTRTLTAKQRQQNAVTARKRAEAEKKLRAALAARKGR